MSEQKFYTGFIPTPPETRAKFRAAELPNIPESDWVEINRRKFFHDLKWYPDQLQSSGCVGFSSAMSVSKARAINGQPPIKLGGAYLYSLINGGRDAGSNIGDALIALKKYGCAPEAVCDIHQDFDFIYRQNTEQFDSVASRFRGEFGFAVETPEEAALVILAGGILEFAVHVGRSFGNLDSEGVCRYVTGGGNHAVHADGLKFTNGSGWCVDMQTWTESFADRSRALVPLESLDNVGYQEMWGIFGVIDDPQDTHDPPVLV